MIKRLQVHHAAIIQAQKSKDKGAKHKDPYDEKIQRIIESVHHAAQPNGPQPQSSQPQPNQLTPPRMVIIYYYYLIFII
jgi:hypothetical protein